MRKNLVFSIVLFLVTFLSGGAVRACELERHEFEETHMAVPVRIILYSESPETAKKAADAGFLRFRELNAIMSDYDGESELMKLCAAADAAEGPISQPLSYDLFNVLKAAQHYSELSEGAFDATVGPIVRLWRRARRIKELPKPEMIERALESTGYKNMEIDEKSKSVRLLKKGMRLDLGGIAKGYALDEAIKAIRKAEISIAMVDAGGDVRLGDPPPYENPDTDGWKVAIAKSRQKNGEPIYAYLSNRSVACSGDTFQYLELGEHRYSHIVDPRTGMALKESNLVTVMSENDAMAADALASALSVLSPEEGIRLVEKIPKTEALIFSLDGEKKIFRSSGWKIEL